MVKKGYKCCFYGNYSSLMSNFRAIKKVVKNIKILLTFGN